MPLNTNPFIEGIDPTSTFGGYASVLLQLIREAKPSSTYGMILFDTTAPDVTGANAWRKTCVWLDLTNPNIPTVNVYREGGSPGWVNVNNIIGNGAIVNAMIANLAVTIAKLSPAGGTANQLIRVNAGATAFEFVSLSSLVTTGSLNVGSLITLGIPGGEFRLAGTYGPGVATWYTAQNVIDNLASASIPTDLIGPAPAATSRSQFLTTRLGDPFAAWRYFDPTNDLQANALNGNRLTNNTVALSKIIPASADAVMVTQGGVVDWVPASTLTGSITQFVTDLTTTLTQGIPTVGTPTTLAHSLAAVPISYRVTLYCNIGDANYVNGDEIDALSCYSANGFTSDDQSTAFGILITSTNVVVRRQHTWSIYVPDKTTGAAHAITLASWRLRLYAMKVN
jgi:hypothetical protein